LESESATLRPDSSAHTEPEGAAEPVAVRKGSVVGRYVVLREVGRGAMGAVHAAYDPRLDRRVALKLLLDRSRGPEAMARLLREAQSLARLDHPNVVTVHDVGEFEDRVFVAMEFVEGKTLRQWQREEPRAWRDVLDVYRQAARGLAAAHAAGVVHRDFKPENAMITDDGRIKVMDFGLARSGPPSSSGSGGEAGDLGESTLTRAGTLLGTPAYMSPEQFSQQPIGPASDQFSFCVALWEALVGQRPFDGGTLHELSAMVTAGRMRELPRRVAVPGWLLQVVRTGLAPRPDDRHASMDALLLAIDRGLVRRRRFAVAAGGVVLVGAMLASTLREGDDASCRRADEEIRGLWTPSRADEIEAALVATGHARAHDSWQRARTDVDAFVEAWIEQYDHLCGAWKGTLPEPMLAVRRQCLDVQRDHLEGLLDGFAEPTSETIGFAVAATSGLPRPDECAQIDSLENAPPPQWVEEVTAAQRLLAHARARRQLGDRTAALAAADAALAALHDVPAPRTRAQILAERADMRFFAGAIADGEQDIAQAQRLAAQSDDAELVARLWIARLVNLNIHHPDQLDRQEHLLEAVELAVAQASEPPQQVARLAVLRGVIALDRGHFDDARTQLEQGIALAERAESTPSSIASYHDLVGQVLLQQGQYDAAKAKIRRAIEIAEEAYGPAYPSLMSYHGNLGGACMLAGDWDEARAELETVAAMLDAAGDRSSAARGFNLTHLAELEHRAGNMELARRRAEEAMATWRALGLDDALESTPARLVLFAVALEAGRNEEALALAEATQRTYARHRGPDHPESVAALSHVVDALRELGRYEEALAAAERLLSVREALLGDDHDLVATARGRKAEVLAAMGRFADAVEPARRAHEALSRSSSRPELRASSAFLLARVMWEANDDRPRAVELARAAIRDFDASSATVAADRRDVIAWLRERE
jgi:tetratricopeptide (TPR) repeat protein/predicted Ser/Thr protein kinase